MSADPWPRAKIPSVVARPLQVVSLHSEAMRAEVMVFGSRRGLLESWLQTCWVNGWMGRTLQISETSAGRHCFPLLAPGQRCCRAVWLETCVRDCMRTSGFFDFGLSVPQLLDVWVCMWRIRTGISQYGTVSDYMFRSSANSAAIAEQRGHTWLACSSRGMQRPAAQQAHKQTAVRPRAFPATDCPFGSSRGP